MNIMFKFVGKITTQQTHNITIMENIDWANLKFGYMLRPHFLFSLYSITHYIYAYARMRPFHKKSPTPASLSFTIR